MAKLLICFKEALFYMAFNMVLSKQKVKEKR